MNDAVENAGKERFRQLIWQCLFLALSLVLPGLLIGWWRFNSHGQVGLMATLIAGLVCFIAGTLALMLTTVFRGERDALNGLLMSVLVRTGLPLIAAILITNSSQPLAEAGLFGMIVIFYLIMLFVETILAVRTISLSAARSNSA